MATAEAVATRPGYHELEIDAIESSGLNPRTHWNKTDDTELQESIRSKGVMEPIIVRPHPRQPERFQIVAGERRHRAAVVVGLGLMPAMVREVSDEELLELALAENIQRRSMHPLDEANGFVKRLEMGKTSPEQLAAALGLSPRYVRDRIRLTKLSAKAAKGVESGRIPVSHAILLAKLDPKLQDRAIDDCEDYEFDFEAEVGTKRERAMQPLTALKSWIGENVPLDPTSAEAQEEFPELATEVQAAAAKGATVVVLSDFYNYKSKPGDPLSKSSWEECKKSDKAAQVGFIVDGHRRGSKVHWKPKAEPKRETSSSSPAKTKLSAEAQKRREREIAADRRRMERDKQWKDSVKDAQAAVEAHITAMPVAKLVAGVARAHYGSAVKKAKTPDELIRALAVHEAVTGSYSVASMASHAKPFGFDVAKWFNARLKQNKAVHKLHAPKTTKKR